MVLKLVKLHETAHYYIDVNLSQSKSGGVSLTSSQIVEQRCLTTSSVPVLLTETAPLRARASHARKLSLEKTTLVPTRVGALIHEPRDKLVLTV